MPIVLPHQPQNIQAIVLIAVAALKKRLHRSPSTRIVRENVAEICPYVANRRSHTVYEALKRLENRKLLAKHFDPEDKTDRPAGAPGAPSQWAWTLTDDGKNEVSLIAAAFKLKNKEE